ncbi:hypothetical protein ABID42_004248 [Arcicella rosea]
MFHFCLFLSGITSFNPDHFSSMAQTSMSTNPLLSAMPRTIFPSKSVSIFADFLYHEIQIIPFHMLLI